MTANHRYALLPCLLWLAGCPKPVPHDPTQLVVAIDRSESTASRREKMLGYLDTLAEDADSAQATLDVWAFDMQPARVWGPRTSEGKKPLEETKATEFIPNPNRPRRGTRPGLLLKALAADRFVRRLEAKVPLRIVLLTDGGIDHADDPALLKAAGQSLAQAHPNFQVLVVGIESQERLAWDKALGGSIAQFKAVSWTEADAELRQLNLGGK